MNFEDYATYREITTQTRAWSEAIEVVNSISLPEATKYKYVVFTGCGSTYYLATAIASLCQTLTGIQSRSVPASELLFNYQSILSRNSENKFEKTLLVAISRSGTTTETVRAVEQFKNMDHGDVVVISNYDEALSRYANVNIVIPEGQEISVAQTRSFASMYVAGMVFCTHLARRNDLNKSIYSLPKIGEKLINDYEKTAREFGEDLIRDSFFFLGSGLQYGLASELSLKLKEMTITHSEPFHFMEFRHGPMSMVNDKVGIIGLVSEVNYSNEMNVLSDMHALGGRIFTVGESGTDVAFKSQLPEQIRGVIYLPILQLMAFYRSLKKGLNPDTPKNLSAVVNLDL